MAAYSEATTTAPAHGATSRPAWPPSRVRAATMARCPRRVEVALQPQATPAQPWRQHAAMIVQGPRLAAAGSRMCGAIVLWRIGPLAHVRKEGDIVAVSSDFMSDSEDAVLLKKGMKGIIKKIDKEGDANIDFDDLPGYKFVFKKNFDKLRIVTSSESLRRILSSAGDV
eukprot:gene17771-biopygen8540